jgi:hypothetical protein
MKRNLTSLNATFVGSWGGVHQKFHSFSTVHSIKINCKAIFLIIRINLGVNPTSLFIFYDTNSRTITHHKIHFGKNYYKSFTSFIYNTLEETKFKDKEVRIWAPKYFINTLLINKCNSMFGVLLMPYSRKTYDLPSVIDMIKSGVRDIKNLDKESFGLWVKEFNLNKKHKGLFAGWIPGYIKNIANKITGKDRKINLGVRISERFLYNWNLVNKRDKNFNRTYSSGVELNTNQNKPNKYTGFKEISTFWNTYTSDKFYPYVGVEQLSLELEKFFNFYEKIYKEYKYFAIIFKMNLGNGEFRSCSFTQVSTLSEFNVLLSILGQIFFIPDLTNKMSCSEMDIDIDLNLPKGTIYFDFKPLKTVKGTKYEKLRPESEMNRTIKDYSKYFEYKGFKFPTTMDLSVWPDLIFSDNYDTAFVKNKSTNSLSEGYTFNSLIRINEDNYEVLVMNKDGNILYTFTDYLLDRKAENLTRFKRVLIEKTKGIKRKKIFYYSSDKLIFYEEEKPTKFIDTEKKDKKQTDNYLTLDLETRMIGNKMVPICMSIFDGMESKSFLFPNSERWKNDMETAIRYLMKRKYYFKKIYIHNFSYFDSIFMIDVLSKLGKLDFIIRENRIIQLTLTFVISKSNSKNLRKASLYFNDSYLVLPHSLRKLCKNFDVKTPKIDFPIDFLNLPNFNFDYKGIVPDYKLFKGSYTKEFTLDVYAEYIKKYLDKDWVLKRELIHYCEVDTIALHQVIAVFSKNIFDLFKVDITRRPTLPSIAFKIFRSNFLKDANIPKILLKIYKDISLSYFGGISDVYRPEGKDIHSYDVNSLYPSVMAEYPMPVGTPRYFKGNPYIIDKDPFGFFHVKVEAPDMYIPFLPTNYINPSGSYSTICPIGNWEGWYFSEEVKNAEKYGYKFEIIEGYLFERKNVFEGYVDVLYKIKCSVDSSSPLYFIIKLLLNALYGRFGMDPDLEINELVTHDESEKILYEKSKVKNKKINDQLVLTSYKNPESDLKEINVSVPIASAISAYSRIRMSHYLAKYKNNILAMDTDGIKVDCHLDPTEISAKILGKMKYEYTFKTGIFPAPKVYGGSLQSPYKNKLTINKIKGVKVSLSYLHLFLVMYEGSTLVIDQYKWKRSLTDSTIYVNLEKYTLSISENKREIVYDCCGKFVDTKPLTLEDGIIKRKVFILFYLNSPCLITTNLRLNPPKSLLSLPSSNIIYLPQPVPHIIRIYPSLPPVIFVPPTPPEFSAKLDVCLPNKVSSYHLGFNIQVIDLKLNKTTIYSSYRKVERALNMGSGTITRRMKGNITKPYKKRYLITKIN